jgi:hypothetical protein
MKKSIIAVAVLAASGASFAQVAVTGFLGFGYQNDVSNVKGLKMYDGSIAVSAKEDIGGGTSVTASTSFDLKGRDQALVATDATLVVASSMGALTLGAIEYGNPIGAISAGVSLDGYADTSAATAVSGGAPIDGAVKVDYAGYSAKFGAFNAGLAYAEIGTPVALATASTAGNPSGVSAYVLTAGYAAGPVAANLTYDKFNAPAALAGVYYVDGATRTTLTGSYDAGVAKIGAGVSMFSNSRASQYRLGVSAPVGPVTVGLDYSYRASQSLTTNFAAADSMSGVAVGASYALGKMTNVTLGYATYSSGAGVDVANANEYRIGLKKSF